MQIDNDIHPKEYLDSFWVDSLVHDERSFHFLLETMGKDKICLGSDYPFPLGEHYPGSLIESMDFSLEEREGLLYKNAGKWLGRDFDEKILGG